MRIELKRGRHTGQPYMCLDGCANAFFFEGGPRMYATNGWESQLTYDRSDLPRLAGPTKSGHKGHVPTFKRRSTA